ncbi:MAG: hypothetical protein LBE13_16160, partial [Bacteroidales bacterium]|nr:hypothetical protein [Bacteroidales bacterium]
MKLRKKNHTACLFDSIRVCNEGAGDCNDSAEGRSKERHCERSKERHCERSEERHCERSKERHCERSEERHCERSEERHCERSEATSFPFSLPKTLYCWGLLRSCLPRNDGVFVLNDVLRCAPRNDSVVSCFRSFVLSRILLNIQFLFQVFRKSVFVDEDINCFIFNERIGSIQIT